eukprot:Opistho-1_new@63682
MRDDRRGVAQHGIALGMAVLVVEPLEMIEIDHHDRHFLLFALGELDGALERILHIAAVVEAGQRIAQRLAAQFRAEREIGERERHRIGERSAEPGDFLKPGVAIGARRLDAEQPEHLAASGHRDFKHEGTVGMMFATQLVAAGMIDVRLAALECPALVEADRIGGGGAVAEIPACRQHQPVARVAEDVERAGEVGQQFHRGGAQHHVGVALILCALEHVGHLEQAHDLFARAGCVGDRERACLRLFRAAPRREQEHRDAEQAARQLQDDDRLDREIDIALGTVITLVEPFDLKNHCIDHGTGAWLNTQRIVQCARVGEIARLDTLHDPVPGAPHLHDRSGPGDIAPIDPDRGREVSDRLRVELLDRHTIPAGMRRAAIDHRVQNGGVGFHQCLAGDADMAAFHAAGAQFGFLAGNIGEAGDHDADHQQHQRDDRAGASRTGHGRRFGGRKCSRCHPHRHTGRRGFRQRTT